MREGEELKAPRHASAAATRDYITACDIIPNMVGRESSLRHTNYRETHESH